MHCRCKKNHLSWSPGQVKFQSGQAYIFIQCPTDKYKKYSARLYFLECPALFGNRTSKNLGALVYRLFYTLLSMRLYNGTS